MRQLISDNYKLIILIILNQIMGTVVQLKNKINNSYFQLRDSNEQRLALVEERIEKKLDSHVELVKEMTDYHIKTGGKRLRALLTLILSLIHI